jgi:hypothetical protein
MQDRVVQLEALVLSLMGSANKKSPDQLSDPSHLSQNFGRISLENTEKTYVESNHWIALLDGVCHFMTLCANNGDCRAQGPL